MKRKALFAALLAAAFLFTGCSGGNGTGRIFDEEKFSGIMSGFPDKFTYENVEHIFDYDIGDDGTLYALCGFYEADGSVRTELRCFSPDGDETNGLGTVSANTVLWDNGKLYLTCGEKNSYYFSVYDPESGESERLADAEIIPENTVLIGNTIYYTGTTESRRGMREFIGAMDFEYDGTLLYSYTLGEDKAVRADVEYPISICENASGELCVYAADENGTYFADGIGGKKTYNDLGKINSLGFTGENSFVFCSDKKPISLNMGRTDSDSIFAELAEDTAAYRIKVRGGYAFYISGFTGRLERINCSAFDKRNEIIRFLSPEYTFNKPFSIGYMTDYKELDDESFSLAVLSQDSGYDIFMVNSYDGFSSNIRDKGSFYPLNDVPNVREYLDECFPFIKDAATDEDGNIRMLPISVNIPLIMFNEDNCTKSGLDFHGDMTIKELIELCEKANGSEFKNGYDIHPYPLTQNLFVQYMAGHDNFDSPELRKFAEFAKDRINMSEFPPYFSVTNEAMNDLYINGENAVLFSYLYELDRVEWLSRSESFDFRAVPGITENAKPAATCTFISVNPVSSNLSAALDYVADLAEYLGQRENSFMLSDKSSYTENKGIESAYGIVSNAEIGFNIPEEIWFEPYVRYHKGEISLDEFIAEADRKLSAYRNE